MDFFTSPPTTWSSIRTPALSRLPGALQTCSSMVDGVIPGLLAYAARADWPGVEFLLLRDSRHAICMCRSRSGLVDRGGGERILVVWIFKHGRHYSVGEAI
jgi:hypothetical protein